MKRAAFRFAMALFATAAAAAAPVVISPVRDGNALSATTLPGCRILIEDREDAPPRSLPCGPFVPETGRRRAWIESDRFISRAQLTFDYPGGAGTHTSPVVPAARVRITREKLDPRLRVRLFEVSDSVDAFSRGLAGDEALMPAGKVVAVAFDGRDRVVAVSGPQVVAAGKTTEITLAPPVHSAVAIRASIDDLPSDEPFELLREGQPPATFLGPIALAIWYDLEAAATSVDLRSERLAMPPLPLELRRNTVTFAEVVLRRKPSLTVRLEGTDEVLEELGDIKLSLRAEGEKTVLRTAEVNGVEHTFAFVPPRLLRCVLEAGSVRLEQRADLTVGADATITFALEPVEVSGRVTHGGRRVRADVELRQGGEESRVQTDESGAYSVRLWRTGKFVAEVRITEPPLRTSHTDLVDIDEDTSTLDFDVPDTKFGVRVVDEASRAAIPRANVTMFNSWEDSRDGRRKASRTVFADDEGRAILPPLRAGDVVVHATAEGFEEIEPLRFAVSDENAAEVRWVELPLRRKTGRSLQLRLAGGAPAANAEVFAVGDGGREWGGRANGEGLVSIPADFRAGLILARHRSGHAAAGRVLHADSLRELMLAAPAGPLVVRIEGASGEAVPFARLAFWVDGVPLTPAALAFLGDGQTSADATGVWIARGMPSVPVRIAAARDARPPNGHAQAAFAQEVRPPWPPLAIVPVQ